MAAAVGGEGDEQKRRHSCDGWRKAQASEIAPGLQVLLDAVRALQVPGELGQEAPLCGGFQMCSQ